MAVQPNKKSAGKLSAENNLTAVELCFFEVSLLTTLRTQFSWARPDSLRKNVIGQGKGFGASFPYS
jgi:hypothetical protein